MGFLSYLTGAVGPSGFGSASTAEDVTATVSLSSYTVIITGATSGIGRETARVLAKRGAHVVIPARNVEAAKEVQNFILKENPNANVTVGELDLSSLQSIRNFVDDFSSRSFSLNILINNAGIQSGHFALSTDGLELDFATNHMGHFLLTNLLLDNLRTTSKKTGIEGRIVNVSSEAHRLFVKKGGIDFSSLTDERSFNWMYEYCQSKLANILHAKELANRLKEEGANVTVNAVHPGTIKTNLPRHLPSSLINIFFFVTSKIMKTISQGAATQCYVATHQSLKGVSGKYFVDCNESSCSSAADNMELAQKLWAFSENFVENH